MPDDAVTRFVIALKRSLRVATDEELAEIIGVGKSTIASWRRRGLIPRKWQLELQLRFGLSFHKFEASDTDQARLSDAVINAAVYLAVMKLGRHLPENDLSRFAAWLAENDHKLRLLVLQGVPADKVIQDRPENFVALLLEIASGRRATPAEIVELVGRERQPPEIEERFLT